jgi:hypothetical protein
MSSVSDSTAFFPFSSEDNSSIEEMPRTKRAVPSTRMKKEKKMVTRKDTKKPSVAKHFVHAVLTTKKFVKSPPPRAASAIDANERNKRKKKPLKLKKVLLNISPKKRVVESALPSPTAASAMLPKELKKKGHATKKRAVQALLPPVQNSKRFKPTEPDITTKKTSSKKIVSKHRHQVEDLYDTDESSSSASKPTKPDITTKKTSSKKGVSKHRHQVEELYDTDESSSSASKQQNQKPDKTTKKVPSKKRVSKQAIQLEEPSDTEELYSSASKESSVFANSKLSRSAILAAADNTSAHDKHDNVVVSDSEMVDVAFMSDVPDDEVTQRQRLEFNERAFGYDASSDIFPPPPKSSTQFTDEK